MRTQLHGFAFAVQFVTTIIRELTAVSLAP